MLYIETRKNRERFIWDVEVAFNKSIQLGIKDIPLYDKVLKTIDKAEIVGIDAVKTPLGVASIDHISSGSKCLLLALKNPDVVVNFDEAGPNVLKLTNEIATTRDIKIYLSMPRLILGKNNKINVDGMDSTINEWR